MLSSKVINHSIKYHKLINHNVNKHYRSLHLISNSFSSKTSTPTTATNTNVYSLNASRYNSIYNNPTNMKQCRNLSYAFQADTAKLLDIVTNSIYSDRDVFMREIVSNSADALEKLRHYNLSTAASASTSNDNNSGESLMQDPLEIRITVDKENKRIIIADTGIGMSNDDMKTYLGTIAKSGSKEFTQNIKSSSGNGKKDNSNSGMGNEKSNSGSTTVGAGAGTGNDVGSNTASNIIGQFGVGFYSAFMVGKRVRVVSKPAIKKPSTTGNGTDGSINANNNNNTPYVWSSTGMESFTLEPLTDKFIEEQGIKNHGTRIIIDLKDNSIEYADISKIKSLLTKYSNFVSFPIYLNDERVNTIEAIWSKQPSEVTEQQYKDFYKFCAHAFDDPLMHLHFKTDAPIDIKALLFVPQFQTEKAGMARMAPGVSVYSRKVLLESNSEKILPPWLRFVRGVVDSDDLPLSISRETMQDSKLMTQLKGILTKRLIKFWVDKSKKDTKLYETFWNTFGHFIKEGICSDYANQGEIAKLLRFNSSQLGPDELTSLDEYISRCDPSQDKIYYLSAPSRQLAEASSYLEVFSKRKKKVEVLFVYHTIDDFVMSNLGEYNGRKLVAAESGEKELGLSPRDENEAKDESSTKDGDDKASSTGAKKITKLNKNEATELREWMSKELSDVVIKVEISNRLVDSPAVVVNHESASLRRMMKLLDQEEKLGKFVSTLPKQEMEINPNHPIIVHLYSMRNSNPKLASNIARQVFDGALIGAGLVDDARTILPRMNSLIEQLMKIASGNETLSTISTSNESSNKSSSSSTTTGTSTTSAT